MPIDPNIPLLAGRPSGPFGPDMSQVWNSYNQAYRGQLQQNDLAGQNALRDVFRNQNALDPNSGLPLTSALAPVGQANPQTYLETLAAITQIQSHQNNSAMRNMLRSQKLVGSWDSAVAVPLIKLDDDLKRQNIPDDQRQIMLGQKQKELTDTWQNQNAITDSDRAKFDRPYSPDWKDKSTAFNKRQEETEKHWVHHVDGNGIGYWTNDYLGQGQAFTEDRSAPYKPVGGVPPKEQPKLEPFTDKLPDGTTVQLGYDPRANVYYKKDPEHPEAMGTPYNPVNPQKPGTTTERPRELTGAGQMEAQIKNPDGSTTARNVRQERMSSGDIRTTYADGPDAGKEVPKEQLGTVRPKSGSQASQEGIDATAESIAKYQTPPLSPYAQVRGSGPDIMAAVKKINPDYNAQKYYQANAVRQDFARGMASRRVDSLNTAIQHLDVFDDLGKGLDNTASPAANRVINYVNTQLGRPEVTSFNVAQGIIADEVVKAVVGSGAVFDRQGLQSQLTNARSPAQLQEAEATIKRLMAGQVGSLEQRWNSVGLPKEEFSEKLLPETSSALDKYLPKSQREGAKTDTGGPPTELHPDLDAAKKALAGKPPMDYPLKQKDANGKVVRTIWYRVQSDRSVIELPGQ